MLPPEGLVTRVKDQIESDYLKHGWRIFHANRFTDLGIGTTDDVVRALAILVTAEALTATATLHCTGDEVHVVWRGPADEVRQHVGELCPECGYPAADQVWLTFEIARGWRHKLDANAEELKKKPSIHRG